MKAIKIAAANAEVIESALLAVNGKAREHAYTTLTEIEALARCAEKQLESLGIAKTRRTGAVWSETSGEAMPNAYNKKCRVRKATLVRLERRATGWFLTDARSVEVWQQGGGPGRLAITKAQEAEAIAAFKQSFSVIEG